MLVHSLPKSLLTIRQEVNITCGGGQADVRKYRYTDYLNNFFLELSFQEPEVQIRRAGWQKNRLHEVATLSIKLVMSTGTSSSISK